MLEHLWGRGVEGCGEGRVDWRDTYDYLTKSKIQVRTALLPKGAKRHRQAKDFRNARKNLVLDCQREITEHRLCRNWLPFLMQVS